MQTTKKISSGVTGFDALLGGGIPRGNIVIIAGHPGTGKTTFCSQFLCYGSEKEGEKSLYVAFSEVKAKLFRNMLQFGMELASLEEKGLLRAEFIHLNSQSSVAEAIDQVFKVVNEFHPARLVIDSVSALALATPGGRTDVIVMLQNLFARLSALEDCTTLLVAEMSSGTDQFGNGIEEFISDGIVVIRFRTRGKARVKSLEVKKMRGTSHSYKNVLFENLRRRGRSGPGNRADELILWQSRAKRTFS